jgi:hypothetical protein
VSDREGDVDSSVAQLVAEITATPRNQPDTLR